MSLDKDKKGEDLEDNDLESVSGGGFGNEHYVDHDHVVDMGQGPKDTQNDPNAPEDGTLGGYDSSRNMNNLAGGGDTSHS